MGEGEADSHRCFVGFIATVGHGCADHAATITLLPPASASYLPIISLSYGQSFHVNDCRIGTTAMRGGTVVAKARSYQLVASKTLARTEFRVTLEHVTSAQQLGRISNDTGLQEDEGPGILKSIAVTAQRNFSR